VGWSAEFCQTRQRRSVGLQRVGHALPHVSMKLRAGCFCVSAAALRFLSVGSVIEARSTAPEPARKRPAATDKGKPGDAIRRLRGGAPCTPSEAAGTVLDGNA
jgi:hypothetical protein